MIFPELKKISLDLDGLRCGVAGIGELLLKQGVDVAFDFTDVGVMKLCDSHKDIEFRFGAVWQACSYYAALPAGHKELRFSPNFDLTTPKPLEDLPPRFVREVKCVFSEYHSEKTWHNINVCLWKMTVALTKSSASPLPAMPTFPATFTTGIDLSW